MPRDFDERYFQCAPEDQQTASFLRGGESVELFNLTPEGFLSFRLPRLALGLRTRFSDDTVTHRPDLHTVILEPDYPRVSLVWHAALPCHGRRHQLKGTTIYQKKMLH